MSGNQKVFEIEYLSEVAKDLYSLPKTASIRIKTAIEQRLIPSADILGKPLRYSLKEYRRIRVGDYRIVYRIEKNIVLITAIKHRKDVYEK